MNRHRLTHVAVLLAVVTVSIATRACTAEEIFRTRSEFNEILVSEDAPGERTLRFEEGGARQSVVKLGDPDYIALPYAKAVHVGLALVDEPKRVLVVGLGGGTIPQFLRHHFPKLAIDVVELDPVVIQVAKRYFDFREDDEMRAFAEDGRAFIERAEPVYDVIYLDAYSADNVPYALTTREFLLAVRKALAPGGVVVGNVWSSRSNRLYDSMIRTYQHVFRSVAVVDVQGVGNKIVVAAPRTGLPAKAVMARMAESLAKQAAFPYDLGRIVQYGYHPLGRPDARVRVLTDR